MSEQILWVGYPRSYTPGRVRPPQYVVLHGTAGNEGPTSAEAGANYDKNRTDGTSCHYFVDSEGPALQEVPDGDRSHSAYFYGNEIGIHVELCGLPQTREQWLDPVSYATLQTAAWLTRTLCQRHGFELKKMTVDEVYRAYYAPEGSRPTGYCQHADVTYAYGAGDHLDLWDGFPWDVFNQLVVGQSPEQQEAQDMLMIVQDKNGDCWVGDGFVHRKTDRSTADSICATLKYFGGPSNCQVVVFGALEPTVARAIVGPEPWTAGGGGGSGLSFEQTVEAARQGANAAEDS